MSARTFVVLLFVTLCAAACVAPGAGPLPTAASVTAAPATAAPATAAPKATLAASDTPAATLPAATETAAPAPGATAEPATPPPTAQPAACALAYTTDNKLFCLGPDNKPVQIAQAAARIDQPRVSPDGAWVAFIVQMQDGTTPLWVAHGDGSGAKLLAGPDQVPSGDPNLLNSPLIYQWRADTHTLYLNTHFVELNGQGGPGQRFNGDLWSADADAGQVEPVLARNTSGNFALSPDGRYAALSTGAAVDMLALDSGARTHLIDFQTVNTASEWLFMPRAAWSPDSRSFSVAIPSPDPFAADASATFYRIDVSGSVQKGATVKANLSLEVAPDGAHAAYGTLNMGSEENELHLVNADGSGEIVADRQKQLFQLGWAPDSQHYAYSAPGAGGGVAVTSAGEKTVFAPGMNVVALSWIDGQNLAYYAQSPAGQWGLYVQRLGEKLPEPVIGSLPEGIAFDARR